MSETTKKRRTPKYIPGKPLIDNFGEPQSFLNPELHMLFPGTDQWMDRLKHALYHEYMQGEMLTIVQFCKKYNIARNTLRNWSKRDPLVGELYENFCMSLADSRLRGAMQKKLDTNAALRGIHLLDPEQADIDKYMADMKHKNEDTGAQYIFKIETPQIITAKELEKEHGSDE